MSDSGPRSLAEIENSEHIDPLTTGDNVAAKKVVPYQWDNVTNSWARVNQGLVNVIYDSITLTQTTGVDTWKFLVGGVSGTLAATVTITYTDDTNSTIASVVRT